MDEERKLLLHASRAILNNSVITGVIWEFVSAERDAVPVIKLMGFRCWTYLLSNLLISWPTFS